ncbi:MAG: secretin and TonB N-terminal domain-containing protein [Planctomycetaceae bacterium]
MTAAEAPRYRQTTRLAEETTKTSSKSNESFTGKVKSLFKRDKEVEPAVKKYGVSNSDSKSVRRDEKKVPQELAASSQEGPSSSVAKPVPLPALVRTQSEIPLQPRHFDLQQQPSGPNPLAQQQAFRSIKPGASYQQTNFQGDPFEPPVRLAEEPSDLPPVPGPPTQFEPTHVPLEEIPQSEDVRITNDDDLISLIVRDAPVGSVLSLIAENQGINIITSGEVNTRISVTVSRVTLEDALNAILASTGYTWIRKSGIIIISPINGTGNGSSQVHGKVLRVFKLNFLSAIDVDKIVQGLLSPVGKSFMNETSSNDTRRTQESIVVEDLPEYVERIAQYISQADIPPRQVMVEAKILEVDLRNEMSHGVNISAIAELAGADISFKTQGFANPLSAPAFLFGIDGTDLDSLLEALQTTTDAKTLADPKLLVLNGQEARFQTGAQLGFLVTTTTETSTLQNVQFLDVGVVLSVTPRISDDNRVMLTVKPEVSEGQINLLTGLPEEETTEVETSVMLANGEAMIIGGLIKETDSDIQNKIPILGDLWGVGRIFQRRRMERRRTEVIIVLVPHILPYSVEEYCNHQIDVHKAMTPLLEGQLQPVDRPWEAELPDAIHDPRKVDWERLKHIGDDLKQPYPKPIEYYVPSVQEKYGLQPYSGPVIYPDYPELSQSTPQDDPTIETELATPHQLPPFESEQLELAAEESPTEEPSARSIQNVVFVEKETPVQAKQSELKKTVQPTRDARNPVRLQFPESLFENKVPGALHRQPGLTPIMEELRYAE